MDGERSIRKVTLCCAAAVEETVSDVAEALAIEEGFDVDVITGADARDALNQRERSSAEPTIFVVCVLGEHSSKLNPLRQALSDQGGPNEHLFAALLDLNLPTSLVAQVRRYAEALEARVASSTTTAPPMSSGAWMQLGEEQEELAKTKRFRANRGRTTTMPLTDHAISSPNGTHRPIRVRGTSKYRAVTLPADGPFVPTQGDEENVPEGGKTLPGTQQAEPAPVVSVGPKLATKSVPQTPPPPSVDERSRLGPWLIGVAVIVAVGSFAVVSRSRARNEANQPKVARADTQPGMLADDEAQEPPPTPDPIRGDKLALAPNGGDEPPDAEAAEPERDEVNRADAVQTEAETGEPEPTEDAEADHGELAEDRLKAEDAEANHGELDEDRPTAEATDDVAADEGEPSDDAEETPQASGEPDTDDTPDTAEMPRADDAPRADDTPDDSEVDPSDEADDTPAESADASDEAAQTEVDESADAAEPAEDDASQATLEAAVDRRDLKKSRRFYIADQPEQDVSWSVAKSVCRRYRFKGVDGWRLPYRRELKGLAAAGKLRNAIYWSDSTDRDDRARAFALVRSTRSLTSLDKNRDRARPICVRERDRD